MFAMQAERRGGIELRDRDTLEWVESIGSGARTYHLYRRREVEVLIRLTACYKRVEEEIFRPGGDFLG